MASVNSSHDDDDDGAVDSINITPLVDVLMVVLVMFRRTPSLGRFLGKRAGGYVNDWRFYVFAEGAQLRLQDALPEQDDDFSLASVGIGTRAQLADWLSGSLDWAFPLLEGTNTDKHDSRLHFSVQASF